MLYKIQDLYKTRFFKNVMSLYFIAAINLFIPILIVPYITFALGLEKFGIFVVCAALFQYGIILTEFSTTSPLVKNLALSSSECGIEQLFYVFRFRLKICGIFLLAALSYISFFLPETPWIDIVLGVLALVGVATNPIAIFQFNEVLPVYAIITCVCRAIVSVCLLVIISLPYNHGTWIAMLFQFSPFFLVTPIAWFWILKKKIISLPDFYLYTKKTVSFHKFEKEKGNNVIKESGALFIGTFFSSLYTLAVPIIVRVFFGDGAAGVYGLIDRISQPVKQAIIPLINVIYPKICRLIKEHRVLAIRLCYKSLAFILVCSCLFFVMSSILKEQIIIYVFKNGFDVSLITPITINIVGVFLSQALVSFFIVPFGMSYILKYLYAILFCIFCYTIYFSVYQWGEIGVYWSLAMLEMVGVILLSCIFLYSLLSFNKNNVG